MISNRCLYRTQRLIHWSSHKTAYPNVATSRSQKMWTFCSLKRLKMHRYIFCTLCTSGVLHIWFYDWVMSLLSWISAMNLVSTMLSSSPKLQNNHSTITSENQQLFTFSVKFWYFQSFQRYWNSLNCSEYVTSEVTLCELYLIINKRPVSGPQIDKLIHWSTYSIRPNS